MPRLRATDSGQVDDVDGIYVLHGRGHFQVFTTREEAFDRKKEIEYSTFR